MLSNRTINPSRKAGRIFDFIFLSLLSWNDEGKRTINETTNDESEDKGNEGLND